jgi:hypothetical protein
MNLVRLAATVACVAVASSSIAAPFPQTASSSLDAYQDFSSKEKCVISNDCGVKFNAVTGSRVLIVHVSCGFAVKTGIPVFFANLGAKDQAAIDTFPVIKTTDISGETVYVINSPTYLFFDKGEVPEVSVLTSNKPVEDLRCTITGYHA